MRPHPRPLVAHHTTTVLPERLARHDHARPRAGRCRTRHGHVRPTAPLAPERAVIMGTNYSDFECDGYDFSGRYFS